jgi:hypothetical protein
MKARRRARVSFFCVASSGHYDLALPLFLNPEAPSRSLSPAPTPPSPPKETQASSSKGTSRRSKAVPKEPKSTVKAKGTTKTKVAAAVEGEDVDMHDGDKGAVAAKESDPPEEDNNDSGEEELEDVEERKAASKRCVHPPSSQFQMLNHHFSAEVALDRRDEMDVEGWKVGDPYVHRTLSFATLLTSS